MTYGYIYKISFPNGKVYIGLTTTSLEKRQEEHKCCAKNGDERLVYKALRKYNMVDTFELEEIDTADNKEELCEKEKKNILMYNSHYIDKKGYNMTYGGEGTNGYVFTEEDKKRNSEAKKEYYKTPGAIQKCSVVQKKRYEDPKEREKNREAQKKRFEDPKERENCSVSQKKRYEDPREIEKNREAQKQYHKENPEAGQKHSEVLKKYFENPEARQKNSVALKQYYKENPDARQKVSEANKQYHKENPEAGQKHSERLKEYFKKPGARQKNSVALKQYYKENPDARQKLTNGKGLNKWFDIYTNDGKFVKSFEYQFEAKEYLQNEYNITSLIKIGEVLRGTRKSSAGFVFKYVTSSLSEECIKSRNRNR
jgi:hypothetical protein